MPRATDVQTLQVVEPVLDMANIQGIAIPGFFKPQQTLLYVRLPVDTSKSAEAAAAFKRYFAGYLPSNGAEALADRRAHRNGTTVTHTVLKAVGLTFQCLQQLVPDAMMVSSPAFRTGLVERSALLGDPLDPRDPGHPSNWKVGGRGQELGAIFVFAGDLRPDVAAAAESVAKALIEIGLEVESEDGSIRTDLPGHEHFGFDDGVSQPGIRGRASDAADDFVTPRSVDPATVPLASAMYGYPGQTLVWPGEFVLGYPAAGLDPLLPGPVAEPIPDWTRNGSFLVYRRLRQDVAAFWNWIAETRRSVKELNGIKNDKALAARLVGRWPSGAPFNRTPDGDNEGIGKNAYENNNFVFDRDSPDLNYTDDDGEKHGSLFPDLMAKADPVGITCPWAAHIRKVNTRDSASDTGASTSTYARRLLRVGVPYGPPIADVYKDDEVDRGLLFLSIQASIENQFEFLQARWMNDPTRPKAPGGNDMLVGQNAPAEGGVRNCVIFPPGSLTPAKIDAPKQWVLPRGGGYFFLPSLSALRNVIGGP
jgi:Dyp-type peroxidase family